MLSNTSVYLSFEVTLTTSAENSGGSASTIPPRLSLLLQVSPRCSSSILTPAEENPLGNQIFFLRFITAQLTWWRSERAQSRNSFPVPFSFPCCAGTVEPLQARRCVRRKLPSACGLAPCGRFWGCCSTSGGPGCQGRSNLPVGHWGEITPVGNEVFVFPRPRCFLRNSDH